MDKVYVITDNWRNVAGELHSTLLAELGVYGSKEKALLDLLNFLDLHEPLDEFKRVLVENTTIEIYGVLVDVVYHVRSTRLDNGCESIYTINELQVK